MRGHFQVIACILVLALGLAGCTAPAPGPRDADADPTEAEEPVAPPQVDLVSHATTTAARWDIRVSAVTEAFDLGAYLLLLNTPDGSIRIEPTDGTPDPDRSWVASIVPGEQVAARPYHDGDAIPDGPWYRITYQDHQEGGAVDVLDSLIITYHDGPTEDPSGPGDPFPRGLHELVLVHLASDMSAGRLKNNF